MVFGQMSVCFAGKAGQSKSVLVGLLNYVLHFTCSISVLSPFINTYSTVGTEMVKKENTIT